MIERLRSAALPKPRFRYCPMVKAGPFYKTAGMIALDPASGKLAEGGVKVEAAAILGNLVAALPDFGLELGDMLSATIYTTDFECFPQINEAWEDVFPDPAVVPARTALGVSALPLEASVEIEFQFYRSSNSTA